MALVGEMVDPKNTAKAMGLLGVAYTAGITMGPMIAGYLDVSLGWPWFFFFLMGLALFIGVLYWATSEERENRIPGSGKISDAFGLARQAFAYPKVRYLSLAAFFLFLGYIGLMTFVADYVMGTFALPADRAGLLLSMGGFFGMMAAPVAGILGDRFGRERIALAGGAVMLGAILGLRTIDYSYSTYLCLFSFFGSGSSAAWTSLNAMAVEAVPHLRKPVSSIYNCLKFSGYAVSPMVLSFLYVPFSIGAVQWACIGCIVVSMIFVSRTGLRFGLPPAEEDPAPKFY
jgi:ACDE family multidrug resistance protein